jgi:hypothetical protein
VEREWLARVAGEVRNLRHAAHRQVCHDRIGANLLRKTGSPRRCLGRNRMPIKQRYTTTPLRQVEGDTSAERPGTDHDDVSFLNHEPSMDGLVGCEWP